MKRLCTAVFSLSLFTPGLFAKDNKAAVSNNRFGWSLFEEVQKSESKDANILFSPLSAWLALTLTSNGSRSGTEEEFTKILAQEGWTREEANKEVRGLLDSLLAPSDSGEKVKIANAVWVNSDVFQISEQFANDTETYYSIKPGDDVIRSESFSDPSALENINSWVSESTDGLIPSIVDQLKGDMASILLNALYFEGQWQIPFPEKLTVEKPFHKASGKDSAVMMMNDQSTDFRYSEDAKFKMLSLGFRAKTDEFGFATPGRYVLDIVLPTKGQLEDLKQEDYEGLTNRLDTHEVKVNLPRFRLDYAKSLVESLEQVGLKQAFEPSQADFTGLGQAGKKQDLYISDVLQKTAAEMNENGFKAAAATAVTVSTTSAPIEQELKEFIADRPFFIALRDTETGALLFQGLINDPQY